MQEKRNSTRVGIKVWADNNTSQEVALWLGPEYVSDSNFKFCYSTRDLSKTGIFLETQTPLEIGSVLDLEFELPEADNTIFVKGKVVRVVKDGDQYDGMGVEFIDLDKTIANTIDTFIKRYKWQS